MPEQDRGIAQHPVAERSGEGRGEGERLLKKPALVSPGAAPQTGGALAGQSFLLTGLAFCLVRPLAKGLAYRGFLLSRLERLFGPSTTGIAGCIILASIVFGLGNWYQGDVGPLDLQPHRFDS